MINSLNITQNYKFAHTILENLNPYIMLSMLVYLNDNFPSQKQK